jgi:hypothetical protein
MTIDSTSDLIKKPSLYEQMLQDPMMREAFFGTTRAQLFGDQNSEGVKNLIKLLDDNSIAFLFSADENLARPILQIKEGQFVGEKEITVAIKYFLTKP